VNWATEQRFNFSGLNSEACARGDEPEEIVIDGVNLVANRREPRLSGSPISHV
jgi:hypothetical protein